MNKLYWVLILVIIVVGGWFLTNQFLNGTKNITSDLDTSTWQEYKNEDSKFSIKHPETVEVTELNKNLVKFLALGPSQSEGTEMYDGISMEIARQYSEDDLKAIIEERIEDTAGIAEIIRSLRIINLGGVEGYTYSFSGLGDFDIYYLPKSTGEYFLISVLAEDPSGEGFEEIVQGMLASFTIN